MLLIGPLIALVLALLAILIVLVIWRLAAGSALPKAGEELFCGKCGYSATGLKENRCPECGSDFYVVGLVPRNDPRRWAPLLAVLAWLFLSPAAFCVISAALQPQFQQTVSSASVVYRNPPSGQYHSVRIGVDRRERFLDQGLNWTISFLGDESVRIHGDEIAGRVTFVHGAGRSTRRSTLTVSDLAQWMRRVFRADDSEMIADEATEIYAALTSLVQNGAAPAPEVFTYGGGGSSAGSMSDNRATVAFLIGSIILWILGIILIVHWARRRQRVTSRV